MIVKKAQLSSCDFANKGRHSPKFLIIVVVDIKLAAAGTRDEASSSWAKESCTNEATDTTNHVHDATAGKVHVSARAQPPANS